MPPYRKSQRGWLTGNSLTPLTGRVLIIPGDLAFVMAVNGALTELTFEWNWEQFGSITPEAAAEAMTIMLADYFESVVVYGDAETLLFGSTAQVKVGAAMILVINTAHRFNGYWQQNPGANGDRFLWERQLDRGSYEFRITYNRTAAGAIMNFKVSDAGGVAENTNFDTYNAVAAVNQVFTGAFTLTKGGEVEISVQVTGRNAGNTTGYLIQLNCIEIWKVF